MRLSLNSREPLKKYRKWTLLLVAVAVLARVCSTYWYQLMIIQGQSMYPSYSSLQPVILERRFASLKAGEVIAFECEALHVLLVKRVVAVPGDTVRIAGGILYVNGLPDMEASSYGEITCPGDMSLWITVPEDGYFVLGDNYGSSKDSRYGEIGCVNRGSIVGRVIPQRKRKG